MRFSITTLFILMTAASAFASYCAIFLVEIGGIPALVGTLAGAGMFILLALQLRKSMS